MNHTTDELVDVHVGNTATVQRRWMSTVQACDVDDVDVGCTQP